METVTMTCMTTKKKFDVEDPTVVQLRNGRYAYKVECPWKGTGDKTLTAFKFASAAAWERQQAKNTSEGEGSDTVDENED